MREAKVDLSAELKKLKIDLSKEVEEIIITTEKKIAKKLCKTLKEKSPVRTGEYADGWTQKSENGVGKYKVIVYNKNKPKITHLLEYGHAKKNGTGRTKPIPHIAPAEQEAIKEFEDELIKKLSQKIGG